MLCVALSHDFGGLYFTHMLCLRSRPPGTGKTRTIVEMMCVASKVLVLAPSNAAVANVALRLVREKEQFGRHNVVVWGDGCDKSVRFLNPRLRWSEFTKFLKAYEREEDAAEQRLKLSDFTARVLNDTQQLSLREVKSLCSDEDGYRSVAEARVVLCTLNTAGSRALRKAVRNLKHKFGLAILDEASQCSEAEFYIATTFPGVKRVVLVGDPKQLGPTVVSEECASKGYGESFLGNILRYQGHKVHLLNTQYRMDPSPLLNFVNTRFYNNLLKSGDSVQRRMPSLANNFLFYSTSSGSSRGT